MKTPEIQMQAIRALQTSVSSVATAHYETEADGSYKIDVALFTATKPI
jgi:hypothetical protein